MQLYRFLFAPVLLAAAVLSGHQQRRPEPQAPAAVVVPAQLVRPVPVQRGELQPRAVTPPVPSRRNPR